MTMELVIVYLPMVILCIGLVVVCVIKELKGR